MILPAKRTIATANKSQVMLTGSVFVDQHAFVLAKKYETVLQLFQGRFQIQRGLCESHLQSEGCLGQMLGWWWRGASIRIELLIVVRIIAV